MSNVDPQKNNGQPVKTGWPIDFEKLRKAPPLWLSTIISTTAILLGLALLIFGLIAIGRLGVDLIAGTTERASEATKSILPLAAAAIGLPLIIWRLIILSQQTRAAEEKTQIDRETHYTSIFSRSVEQLGQTKEVKETKINNGALETASKTVPNIEVRLGGIHSLNRLAETSNRDVKKITNMLLSYVRENSWTDRNGNLVSRPERKRADDFYWRYYHAKGEGDQHRKELNDWLDDTKLEVQHEEEWTAGLPDSRVDVNEAIDALSDVADIIPTQDTGVFYESLFVGRSFKSKVLRSYFFERCIFIKCKFEAKDAGYLDFIDCRLIGCSIELARTTVYFGRSSIINLYVSESQSGTIQFHACDLMNSHFWKSEDLKLTCSYSTMYECYIQGSEGSRSLLNLKSSGFAKTRFFSLKLHPDSVISEAGFADVTLQKVDMSDATVSDSNLNDIKSEPLSLHPSSLPRPDNWPPYNPDYIENDDIPF